jgi:predicted HTH transcriptional regulator
MQIPVRLEDWTLGTIKGLLKAGAFENEAFDFKEQLPMPSDKEGKHRLRKSIAAFANSGGGFLIYGIKDDRELSVYRLMIVLSE